MGPGALATSIAGVASLGGHHLILVGVQHRSFIAPASAFLESVAWRPLRQRGVGHTACCSWEDLLPGCPTCEPNGGEQRPLRPAQRGTHPWEGGRALICAGGGYCPPGLQGTRRRCTDGRGPRR